MTFESVNQIMSQARESGRILGKSKLRCTLHNSTKFLGNVPPFVIINTPNSKASLFRAYVRGPVDELPS